MLVTYLDWTTVATGLGMHKDISALLTVAATVVLALMAVIAAMQIRWKVKRVAASDVDIRLHDVQAVHHEGLCSH
jgi:hypothetical protein